MKLMDLLKTEIRPFTNPFAVHRDGWGLTYLNDRGDLVTTKGPEAAPSSQEYRGGIDGARADGAILHLPKASPAMVNTEALTHPFSIGNVAFAHNGYFSPLAAAEQFLAPEGPSTNDGDFGSERHLAKMRLHAPAEALHRAATRIAAVTKAVALNALPLTQMRSMPSPSAPRASPLHQARAPRQGAEAPDRRRKGCRRVQWVGPERSRPADPGKPSCIDGRPPNPPATL
jgi:predicted glutamine amidotransferase